MITVKVHGVPCDLQTEQLIRLYYYTVAAILAIAIVLSWSLFSLGRLTIYKQIMFVLTEMQVCLVVHDMYNLHFCDCFCGKVFSIYMNILMSNKHTVTVVTVYQELVLVCKDVDKWGLRGAKPPQFFDKTNDVVC